MIVLTQISATLLHFWYSTESILDNVLKDIDPLLFQNVILGVLALLVPIGVGILSFFFEERSKGKIESNLELYILLRQVLRAKQLALFSLLALFLFTLYDLSFITRVFAVAFFVFYISWLLWIPLKNIWKWFFEDIKDFSISFLKNLNIKRDAGTIVNSWQALWLGKTGGNNEREFTKILITHIDTAIGNKRSDLAIRLAQIYQQNLDKRDRFSIGYEILPKIFEWNERFWKTEQEWLNRANYEEKISGAFLSKYFPALKKGALTLIRKAYPEESADLFWDWNYFQREFFPAVAKSLLYDGLGPYQLFTCFKKYVEEAETKIETFQGEEKQQRWWNNVNGLFGNFLPMFFDNIDKAPNNYEIWGHYFPPEWKITSGNSGKRVPRIVLHEFLQWAQPRIYKKDDSHYDKDLTEVITGLFPNAHHELFPAFLMLLFSGDVKYAVQKESSFSIINTILSWSGEKTDAEVQEMRNQQDQSQKSETADLILDYFSQNWKPLLFFKEDFSKDEFSKWDSYSKEQRQKLIDRVRRKKLEAILAELNGQEIVDLCKESERCEYQREISVKLIQILLEKIP